MRKIVIRFILIVLWVPLFAAYSVLKQRRSCGHGSKTVVLSMGRSEKYIERSRGDFCMRRDGRVGKALLQEAGSRQTDSDQGLRRFGRSNSLSPKEDLSVKLLGRVLKACRVIPKIKKTLNEVVQVSLFSLSEVKAPTPSLKRWILIVSCDLPFCATDEFSYYSCGQGRKAKRCNHRL